jgi:hypothetical protein
MAQRLKNKIRRTYPWRLALIFGAIAIIIAVVSECRAQEAPKKANKIQLINQESKEENFNIVMNTLIEQGYEITKNEREFGLVTTGPRHIKGLNAEYYLYIVVRDSSILIKGNVQVNVALNVGFGLSQTPSGSAIENRGMKGSPMRDSFIQMDAFAKSVPSDNVLYLIE